MFLGIHTPTGLAEPLDVGGVIIRNRMFLAPMSGVTDLPFRERAYAHGAGVGFPQSEDWG